MQIFDSCTPIFGAAADRSPISKGWYISLKALFKQMDFVNSVTFCNEKFHILPLKNLQFQWQELNVIDTTLEFETMNLIKHFCKMAKYQ